MSVREQLFLRTDLPPTAIARTIAGIVGGTVDDHGPHAYVTVDTSRLVEGMVGRFGSTSRNLVP